MSGQSGKKRPPRVFHDAKRDQYYMTLKGTKIYFPKGTDRETAMKRVLQRIRAVPTKTRKTLPQGVHYEVVATVDGMQPEMQAIMKQKAESKADARNFRSYAALNRKEDLHKKAEEKAKIAKLERDDKIRREAAEKAVDRAAIAADLAERKQARVEEAKRHAESRDERKREMKMTADTLERQGMDYNKALQTALEIMQSKPQPAVPATPARQPGRPRRSRSPPGAAAAPPVRQPKPSGPARPPPNIANPQIPGPAAGPARPPPKPVGPAFTVQYDDPDADPNANPSGGGKRADEIRANGLYSDQIVSMMEPYNSKGFIGCIASDEIGLLIKPSLKFDKFGFVMNKDDSEHAGSHWVSVYCDLVDDCSLEYFDSFAENPDERFFTDIKELIDAHKLDYYLKMKINRIKEQAESSTLCGFHAMNFLINRFKGKIFKEASGYSDVKAGESGAKRMMEKYDRFGYI